HAQSKMLGDVPIHADQEALSGATAFHVQPAVLDQRVPLLAQVVPDLASRKGRGRINPVAGAAAKPHVAFAPSQLACELPMRAGFVHTLEGQDLRLLVNLCPSLLARGRQVVQVGMATEESPA